MQNFVAAGRDGHPNWRVLRLSALPFQVAGGAARRCRVLLKLDYPKRLGLDRPVSAVADPLTHGVNVLASETDASDNIP